MYKSYIIDVASQINSLYLRKGFIEPADYTITLLFLHIYRDEVLNNQLNLTGAAKIAKSGEISSNELREILQLFPVIHFFSIEDIVDILNLISTIDQEEIRNNFSFVFEKFFNYLTGLIDFKNGAFVVHRNMLDLILTVAEIHQIENVYNPFASNATIGTLLDNSVRYFGQEYNSRVWRIGKLRLLAFGKKEFYSLESSIENWPNGTKKFDLIFSRLPFLNTVKFTDYENLDLENALIRKSLDLLKSNGKIIFIVKAGFLFSHKSENIRLFKDLIEKNLIDKILHFPAGSFRHSGMITSVIILNQNKTTDRVEFIDFTSFLEKYKTRKIYIDWDNINLDKSQFSSFESIEVTNQKIAENNYNLNYLNYLFKENYKGKRLEEYVEILTGKKVDSTNYPEYIVKIKHLDGFESNQELILEKFDLNNIANINSYKVINQRGVLISTVGNKLKPTYFDGSTSILVSHSIYLLKINNKSDLSIRFLIHILSSEEVKKQINAFSKSTSVLKKITVIDLKNIIVDIPSRSKQIEILEEQSLSILSEPKIENYNQVYKNADAKAIDAMESSAILRHKIAGPLSNLIFYAENIQQILEKKASKEIPHLLDLKLNDNQLFNLGELVNKLLVDSKFITNEVINQTQELNVFEYPLKEVNVIKWLENYVKTKIVKHPDVLITLDLGHNPSENVRVVANEDLLVILFDNLFRNIFKHAFILEDNFNKRIEIQVSIDSDDQVIVFFISNTGKPFPENFTMDNYGRKGIRAGVNAGKGIGGYFVVSIINYFKGDWYMTDETGSEGLPDTDLATTFEISLPYILS